MELDIKFYGDCKPKFTKDDMVKFALYFLLEIMGEEPHKSIDEIFNEWFNRQ